MCAQGITLPGRALAITHHPRCKYTGSANAATDNVASAHRLTERLGWGTHTVPSPDKPLLALQSQYFTLILCGSQRRRRRGVILCLEIYRV